MKKNGFTVVELLTTFVLITIVVSLLILMANTLSKIYSTTSVKTELYYKQSIISRKLNESFLNKSITQIDRCSNSTNCVILTYSDLSTKRIEIDDALIHIGDEAFDIVKHSIIGDVKIDVIYSPIDQNYKSDSIFNLRIPITYKNIDGDFGINLVYQFNRNSVRVSI